MTCDENYDHVLKLELKSNGVAGRIPEALFKLTSLTHLDLNDNDMRGEIPESISDAKALQWLRLSYNRLTTLPDSISNLTNLALVHLQNNRMEGDASVINLLSKRDIPKDLLETLPPHRFISDCGDPQVSHFACIAAYFCLSKICSILMTVFSIFYSALLPYPPFRMYPMVSCRHRFVSVLSSY